MVLSPTGQEMNLEKSCSRHIGHLAGILDPSAKNGCSDQSGDVSAMRPGCG
ncbi:hypothetical protein AALB64_12735 [Lachnospiraceae bacterium 45-P1]